MVNLRLFTYVVSKFVLLSLFCVIQCTCLMGIIFFALGFNGGILAFILETANVTALAINATALGLLVSTMVSSAEAAMALTPIALIPQVVLGGLMVPMTTNPNMKPMMYIMPSRWGFEGAIANERLAIAGDAAWNVDLHNATLNSPPDFIVNGKFQCALAQVASDSLNGAWGFSEYASLWLPSAVLFGMTFVMLAILRERGRTRDKADNRGRNEKFAHQKSNPRIANA